MYLLVARQPACTTEPSVYGNPRSGWPPPPPPLRFFFLPPDFVSSRCFLLSNKPNRSITSVYATIDGDNAEGAPDRPVSPAKNLDS